MTDIVELAPDATLADLWLALTEARTEIKRLTLLHEISERQAELKIKELKAENERLQAHAISMIAEMGRENEKLRALLGKLRWKSIDKDNMEFRCEITCYVMDELRTLEPKPMRSNLGPGET